MNEAIEVERLQSIHWGIFYAVCSAFSSALMSVMVKMIGDDLPTSMLVFFRFAASFILLIPFLIRDTNFTFKIHQPVRYISRVFAGLCALFLSFYALKFIPLVDVLLLSNTMPLFVPLIAVLIAGAKTPKKVYFGIVLGFVGVIIALDPDRNLVQFASLIALASGFIGAIAVVQARMVSKTSSTKQMLFYYFLVSAVISGIIALLQWKTPMGWHVWLLLLGVGIFGTAYQIFATLSWVSAPVRITSPLAFMVVVFGGFFDWLIWHHAPSFTMILGFLLVVIGTVLTIYFGQELLQNKK